MDNNTTQNAEKHPTDDVNAALAATKSVLDLTMLHGERIEAKDMCQWNYILQISIACSISSLSFIISWGLWRGLDLSQCSKDIVYFSANSFKTAVFDIWQHGFCYLLGFIYLLPYSVIDFDRLKTHNINKPPMRLIFIVIVCASCVLSFMLTAFFAFANEIVYNNRDIIFAILAVIIHNFTIKFCMCRKYVVKEAQYVLLPIIIFGMIVSAMFVVGFILAYAFRDYYSVYASVYPSYISMAQTLGIKGMEYSHKLYCWSKKESLISVPNPRWKELFVRNSNRNEEEDNRSSAIEVDTAADSNERLIEVDARSIENLWSEELLFFICGLIIIAIEAMRIATFLALRYDTAALIQFCVTTVIIDVLQRNNLFWEILYRVILRKPTPALSKMDSIMKGASFIWDIVPICFLALMNIINYGASSASICHKHKLADLYSLYDDEGTMKYWYMIPIMLGVELLSKSLSELVAFLFRRWKIFPPADEDLARKSIIIRFGLIELTTILISSVVVMESSLVLNLFVNDVLTGKETL